MSPEARLRADIDIRAEALINSPIIERFPTNSLIEILEDQGDVLKVKALRLKKTPSGFVPRISLIFPPESKKRIFPSISLDDGTRTIDSVPADLPARDFLQWLGTSTRPSWISELGWSQLDAPAQDNLIRTIATQVSNSQDRWDAWTDSLKANDRLEEATMDEWSVVDGGGREVFTIREHILFKEPSETSQQIGILGKLHVMRWNGNVVKKVHLEKTRIFYEVDFFRMSKQMKGWFRGDLTAAYIYPNSALDTEIEANSQNAFDLTIPILRHPQDEEIAAAKAAGFQAAQYIDVRRASGAALRHFCLCGEFCTAALARSDVIPLLSIWRDSGSAKALKVLKNGRELTGVGDLISILKLFNHRTEIYNSIPVPPKFIKDRLETGQLAISGCGINNGGKVIPDGKIRHWVVVEDILPVGNSAWVRVYNPFHNREEVYEFHSFMTSTGTGMGLWVEDAVQ